LLNKIFLHVSSPVRLSQQSLPSQGIYLLRSGNYIHEYIKSYYYYFAYEQHIKKHTLEGCGFINFEKKPTTA
jgi:hypothetical protein